MQLQYSEQIFALDEQLAPSVLCQLQVAMSPFPSPHVSTYDEGKGFTDVSTSMSAQGSELLATSSSAPATHFVLERNEVDGM